MCGRFASHLPPEAIRALFRTMNPLVNFPPSWNVAPTDPALVIRRHPDSGERHLACRHLLLSIAPHGLIRP